MHDTTDTVISMGAAAPSDDSVLLRFVRAITVRWRVVLGTPLVLVSLSVGVALARSPRYTSTVSFVSSGSGGVRLTGLAAQFGFDAPTDNVQSPDFYVDLALSDLVLGQVADSAVRLDENGVRRDVSMADALDIRGVDGPVRRAKTIAALRETLAISAGRRTRIVKVEATTRNRNLSWVIADRVIASITRFNTISRSSQAAQERRFLGDRLTILRAEQRAAEDRMQDFLSRNRIFRDSPERTFEYERLNRELLLRAAVVNSITQTFEKARLDEVRDTPVISIVQPAELPARQNPRGVLRLLLVIAPLSLLLGLVIAQLLESFSRMAKEQPHMAMELRKHVGALWDDIRGLIRR